MSGDGNQIDFMRFGHLKDRAIQACEGDGGVKTSLRESRSVERNQYSPEPESAFESRSERRRPYDEDGHSCRPDQLIGNATEPDSGQAAPRMAAHDYEVDPVTAT